MSLLRCIKKLGLKEHETALLRALTADYREDGLQGDEAAIEAIQEQYGKLLAERNRVLDQVRAKAKQKGAEAAVEAALAARPAPVLPDVPAGATLKGDELPQRPERGEPGDAGRGDEARPLRGEGAGSLGLGMAEVDEGARAGGEAGVRGEGTGEPGGGDLLGGEDGRGEQPSRGPRDRGAVRTKPRTAGPVTAPVDYTITDADDLGSGGEKAKYRDNVAAIRLLQAIEAEGRRATPEEQKVLVRYVGWGGLKSAFDEGNAKWAKEYAELKALLPPEEYERARSTILDAHYTSVPVVRAIYAALGRLGVTRGRFLEPAMGTGNFLGLMPPEMHARSTLTGVEFDNLTGRLAKQLYQNAEISAPRGFEDVNLPDGYFDVVVGNPPFGSQSVYDRRHPEISKFSIHNFFFAKAVEKLRPGGVLAMVTSRYFMDAKDVAARQWIADRTRFLGAIRLPYTAFKQNAGTEVVTDIIFLQKLPEGEKSDAGAGWVGTRAVSVDGTHVDVNRYFVEHPEMVLGKFTLSGTMYAAGSLNVEPIPGETIEAGLGRLTARLPEKVFTPVARRISDPEVDRDGVMPAGLKDGNFFVLPDGKLGRQLPAYGDQRRFERIDLESETAVKRIKGLVGIRDALRALMRAEMSPDTKAHELVNLRRKLNEVYDAFSKRWGFVNAQANRRVFQDDPDLPLLESLEPKYDPGVSKDVAKKKGLEAREPSAEKADIFTKRVLQPQVRPTSAASAKDALIASLNERGGVDMDYMAALYGKSPQEIAAELGDMIYAEPDGSGWTHAEEYLSGNVKAKLAAAREAAESDEAFKRNVEALEAVQPKDVAALDIAVRLGSPWVPGRDIAVFAESLLGGRAKAQFIPSVARWSFQTDGTNPVAETATYGTGRVTGHKLIELLLNRQPIVVKDNIGTRDEPVWVVNEEETRAAQAKGAEIGQKFADWIWKDADRRDRLAKLYNDTYNTDRERKHDGAHMTFVGMNPTIELRKHQKDAIWRIVSTGNTLLDHVVGAGKTFVMTAAAMERRRMGLARKPMFVVPNHLVRQWRDEFYRLYPNASILATTEKDFEKANRQRLFARIATGDWDAVIVAHSAFKKIGMPPEQEQKIIGEMRADVAAAIAQLKQERGDRNVLRDMERIKRTLDAKFAKLSDTGKKDETVTFDELGVDDLNVDEAHLFKNLFYFSQMKNVAGLGQPSGSGRAFDMFVKVRFLQERAGGRGGTIFATGTPVSNSLVEMFTMQRYMAYEQLRARDIHLLDAWAGVFGSVEQVYEVHPSGNGYRLATRFAKFTNLPELMTLYKGFGDVITMGDLKAQARDEGKRFPVPKPKTGKPILHTADRSEQQTRFFGIDEFQRNPETGAILFDLDGRADEYGVAQDEKGKWAITQEGQMRGERFETEKEAREAIDLRLRAPKVGYNEGSILWKFEHLRELTKSTKGKINALSITNEARKAGLDYRLIEPSAPDFPGSKINTAIGEIKRLYDEWAEDRGTQLVFLDLSIPSSARKKTQDAIARKLAKEQAEALENDIEAEHEVEEAPADEMAEQEEETISLDQMLALQSTFSVYDDVKAKLIASGIPENEIAFIHDYDTAAKKQKLFGEVRDGRIRVLMGSTEKMGAGMNVQDRLVGVHHLDAPWRPSDLEQRNGRIYRQGNKLYERDPDGFEVEEHRYATRQTYDTRMWQIIEHKANGVEQLRKAGADARTIDDIAGEAATAADMKAAASGNPLILEEIRLRNELKTLEAQRLGWQRSRVDLESRDAYLAKAPQRADRDKDALRPWLVARKPAEPFAITVGDKAYTEKKEAVDALLARTKSIAEAPAGERYHDVGEYRGVVVQMQRLTLGLYPRLLIPGGPELKLTPYTKESDQFSASGFITRLDNALDGIEQQMAAIDQRAERELAARADIAAELAKPFAKEEELAEARRKHLDVSNRLRAAGGAVALTTAMKQELAEALRERGIEPPPTTVESQTEPYTPSGVPLRETANAKGEAARVAASDLLRRFRGTLLGNAVGKEFQERGAAELIGQRVEGPADLAALAQIYRNPAFETLRYFFVRNGIIVGATGVSSRLADITSAFPVEDFDQGIGWLTAQMGAADGADTTVYLLHNHPSGKVEPSDMDITLTKAVAKDIGKVATFGGHVIIDTNKYAEIDAKGEWRERRGDFGQKPPFANPRKGHFLLGRRLSNAGDVAQIAADLKRRVNEDLVLVGRNGLGAVSGIMEIPAPTTRREALFFMGQARRFAQQTGSFELFLVGVPADKFESMRDLRAAVRMRLFADIVSWNGESLTDRYSIVPERDRRLGRKLRRHVASEAAVPAPVRPVVPQVRGVLDPLLRVAGGSLAARVTGPLYDRALAFLGELVPEKVKAGFIADYGLPTAVTEARADMMARIQARIREAGTYVERLGTLDRAQSRIAYLWMTESDPATEARLMEQLPADSRATLRELKALINEQGRQAVEMGFVSRESYERNVNAYLHRTFYKYEIGETPTDRVKRQRAIRVLGEQFKGRGLRDDADMRKIQWPEGELGIRRLPDGRPDPALKGRKFIRFEKRAAMPDDRTLTLPGVDEAEQRPGRITKVEYWPAEFPVPPKYDDWNNAGTWEARWFDKAGSVGLWRDFTPEELYRMGEIQEVKYTVAKTLMNAAHDLEVGSYFEFLAREHSKLIPTADMTIVDASENLSRSYSPSEWVRVPESVIPKSGGARVYGALAGRYVQGAIWNDIRQVARVDYRPLGETYDAILRWWKVNKTARSPVVHFNNVMANFMMADLHDVGARDLHRAIRVWLDRTKDEDAKALFREFEDSGATMGMFVSHELRRETLAPLLEDLRRELDQAEGGAPAMVKIANVIALAARGEVREAIAAASQTTAFDRVRKLDERLVKWYENEDLIFRLAAFIKARNEGQSIAEAGRFARKSFLDYEINAPWIQMMRRTAFPFIGFTYRALPMMLEAIARKPWKLAKYAALAGALNSLAYAALGMGEDDEDRERALLPEEKAGRIWGLVPKLMRMPWNDQHGSPVFLDVRRWVVLGDIFDAGQKDTALPMAPALVPGGPLAILAEFMLNKQSFTGRPITKETDTAFEAVKSVGEFLYRSFAPNAPWIPHSYSAAALLDSGSGKTDVFGREQDMWQAIASALGIKLGSYPTDVLQYNAAVEHAVQQNELTSRMRSIARQAARKAISEEDRDEKLRDLAERKAALARRFAERGAAISVTPEAVQ